MHVMQLPAGGPDLNARAPLERHEIAVVRPPTVLIGRHSDRRVRRPFDNDVGAGVEKTLCRTDCKSFVEPLQTDTYLDQKK